MAMTKAQCAQVRVAINRLATGPDWYTDTAEDAGQDAMLAELRARTRQWLHAQVINHLQEMLPPHERVKLK